MLTLLSTTWTYVSLLCSSALCFYCFLPATRQLPLPLPPGPKPKFLSGNVHQLPRSEAWKVFKQWSETFKSPMTFHRTFRHKIVVLNTFKAANDLLESRSNFYSDRPIMAWMYKELINRKMAVFNISSHHPRFKVYRRLLHASLNPRAVEQYHGILDEERQILLRSLATAPENFMRHIRRVSGGVILKVTYGWTVKDTDDYFVALMEQVFVLLVEIGKSGWLVDIFPILRFLPSWFPGAGFKRQAAVWRHQMSEVDRQPHAWAKEQIESGNYVESFTSQHLCPGDGHQIDAEAEDIIKWCSAALYAGGADTTASALASFVLLMALHPGIQRRAQDEIDEVVGTHRLPTLTDQESLPYISAVIKEVLRVAPVAPLGLPHRALREDEYLGYRIPHGSTVIANIWGITHDAALYPEPMTFNPSRFIASSGRAAQQDPKKIVFGYGRRVCPGAHLAEASLFLNVAGILATFNISKSLDEQGTEVEPLVEYTTGITSHPKPFKCCILPRSPENISMLNLP